MTTDVKRPGSGCHGRWQRSHRLDIAGGGSGDGSGRGGGTSSDKEGEQNAGHGKPQTSDVLAAPATPPLGEPPHDPPRPAGDDPAEEFTDDDERPQATTAADRI